MNWKEIHRIENFGDFTYPELIKGIQKGKLITFKKEGGLVILDTQKFEENFFYKFENTPNYINYKIDNDLLYLSIQNKIYRLGFENYTLELCGESQEQLASAISDKYFLASTYTRKPSRRYSEIRMLDSNNKIYSWEDRKMVVEIYEDKYLILMDNFEAKISMYQIDLQKEIWSYDLLGFTIPRYYQNLRNGNLLFMQRLDDNKMDDRDYQLICVEIATGKIHYASDENHLDRYHIGGYHLHAISGNIYLQVNQTNGNIEQRMEIKELENKWGNISRQSYHDGKIYLTISGQPLIGVFNSEDLVFEGFIEINVKEGIDMSQPLEQPILHKNRLYVRDSSNALHILEKTK